MVYHSCYCVNHLYLPTKRSIKNKQKFKDLSQFRQNKNQYCTDKRVILCGLLTAFPSPYCIRKKVPCTPRFKGTAKFIKMCYGKSLKNATKRRNFDHVHVL